MPNQAAGITDAAPNFAKTATGAAAAAVTLTFPAAYAQQNVLALVALSYTGAASGPVTLTVSDGANPILVLDLSVAVSTPYILQLPIGGLAGTGNTAMTVGVSAGAASSIAKLTALANQY